ncbi:MAG: hypothetical protein LWW94_06850 [Candidatus Desulfofervidaceae bacterium]|nr:hypothetical protein [Candidatus Desulfofervidaceae bacterium]
MGIEPDETIYNKKIANRVGQGIKNHKSETSIPELLKKCDAVIVNHYDKATIYEFEDLLRNKDTGFCVNYQADPNKNIKKLSSVIK